MLVPRELGGEAPVPTSYIITRLVPMPIKKKKKKNFQPLQKARYYYLCLTAYSLAVIRIREIGRDR